MIISNNGSFYEVTARIRNELETFTVKASSVEMAVGQIIGKHGLKESDVVEVRS